MRKILITLLFITLGYGILHAQRMAFKPDTIVKTNGKHIPATIFKVDKFNVVYLNAGTKEQVKISRKEVSHIIYRTGKIQNVSGNVASTSVSNVPRNTTKNETRGEVKSEMVSTRVAEKTEVKASNSPSTIDSVFKRDGKIILVNIVQTSDKVIFYKVGNKKDILSVDKKDVSKIVYNSGKIEEFAAPAPKVPKDIKCDTIIHLSGKRILAQVLKVNTDDVSIQRPEETETSSLLRREIEKIIYRGGRIEDFNKPVLLMIDDTQWESVIVTENASDVVGLYKRGTVMSNSASDSRDVKTAKKSATIRLQKKAAAMKANIVLITRQEAKGGYGEVPGYEMEGVAYGFEPTGEETIESLK